MMDGQMDARMLGCADARMHGYMSAWMHVCTGARMHGRARKCLEASVAKHIVYRVLSIENRVWHRVLSIEYKA